MKELLYLKDDQLKEFIEKIFMSYRDTFSDAKKILNKYKIGVAHHKVIHLISLHKGIKISALLSKLKVTKQSLIRVIKDLLTIKAIYFEKDDKDPRLKHIYLSEKGLNIFNEIFSVQKKRIYNALIDSDSKEVINFNKVLNRLIDE